MFYFRINKLKIVDNRERASLLGVLGDDRAEVKLSSFISTDETRLPELPHLLDRSSSQQRRRAVQNAIQRVVESRVLTAIENVTDNHEMTFGDTGFVLYQSPRIPNDLDWILLAVESDQDDRTLGAEMLSALDSEEVEGFVDDLTSVVQTAANPAFAASVGIAKFVARTFAARMKASRDEMIGLLYTSLNRFEHYRHGERKRDHVPDLTNNMFVDYSLFGFDPPLMTPRLRRLPPVEDVRIPRRRSA